MDDRGGEPLRRQRRLTVYEGVGHDCWLQAYHDPELYEWMLAQRKP